ncbi:hypothetical protein BGW36DRAFT_433185 [Talaromyces proteolyticus]|uniref:Uncharacterized protein n=1 Tax=Talaromyces proteolyticus TaxID=1131652 RepID=A0AAD4KFZ0_9EURO|nr:uncharacterized protein BGW36DRAFT_433185 [Talaromyces proteolyticus]KAH8690233.1 hypothetical protein BGW36DRAFT_433185 [Talaromyces proteolyticus]
MENRGYYIEKALQGAQSILDINHDTIRELQGLTGSMIGIKRHISTVCEMRVWVKKYGLLPGLQYDAKDGYMSIKPNPDPIHKAARGVMLTFLDEIVQKSVLAYPKREYSVTFNQPYFLKGEFEGHIQTSDGQINEDDTDFPRVVVLIGNLEELNRGANKWLYGTKRKTRLVICVEIFERPPPSEFPWGLSTEQLLKIPRDGLSNHILNWHSHHGSSIRGAIAANLFVCDRDDDQTEPVWQSNFGGKDRAFKDSFGDTVPPGVESYRNTAHLNLQLTDGIEVDLPVHALEDSIYRALDDFAVERAMIQADEALDLTKTRDGSTETRKGKPKV